MHKGDYSVGWGNSNYHWGTMGQGGVMGHFLVLLGQVVNVNGRH